MTEFIEFLNQRFVVTITSVLLGGYLLERIAERRARTQASQKKVLDYLEETASQMNGTITAIFRRLRFPDRDEEHVVMEQLEELFRRRFTTQLIGKLYLQNEEFSKSFELLCQELRKVVTALSASEAPEKEKIEEGIRKLESRWPIAEKPGSYDDLETPTKELAIWADMIWKRAQSWIVGQTASTLQRRF